jgi:choline dehydrogenase-like flavoprotein
MKNIIIVGSGAGGATLTRQLAIYGIKATLMEKGNYISIDKAHQCYDNLDVGVELLKTTCIGGSTLVTAGNAVRTCQEEFKKMGIDLTSEFEEVESELEVGTLPDTHFGEGTLKIMDASESMGLSMTKMPKFINPEECIPCGKCVSGCPRDAKWSSLNFLDDAKNMGTKIIDQSSVTGVITRNNQVKGVKTREREYEADLVVLCAGAIETPRILGSTGLVAGEQLFVDTFVTVGGVLKDIDFYKEVSMNALYKGNGFILAPHYSGLLASRLEKQGFHEQDIMGIMVKIKDDLSGYVTDNEVVKNNTSHDMGLIAEGTALAGSILTQAGVDPSTLVSTPARGAHPGGTAAIGEVVDNNLETEIEGLFVCDASVFPNSPGAPPILTILALTKRLAKHIKANIN